MEQAVLPFLRRIAPYNAYAEGWALYAEKVAEIKQEQPQPPVIIEVPKTIISPAKAIFYRIQQKGNSEKTDNEPLKKNL